MVSIPYECVVHIANHLPFSTSVPNKPKVGDKFQLQLPNSGVPGHYQISRIETKVAAMGKTTLHLYCEVAK